MLRKVILTVLTLFVVLLFGGATVVAQEAEKPAEKAQAGEKTEKASKAFPSKPETISGTISMVNTEKKFLVLSGSGGVSYSFKLTGGTRIKIADKKAKLDELANQTHKQASVTFLAERAGNVARSVEVTP